MVYELFLKILSWIKLVSHSRTFKKSDPRILLTHPGYGRLWSNRYAMQKLSWLITIKHTIISLCSYSNISRDNRGRVHPLLSLIYFSHQWVPSTEWLPPQPPSLYTLQGIFSQILNCAIKLLWSSSVSRFVPLKRMIISFRCENRPLFSVLFYCYIKTEKLSGHVRLVYWLACYSFLCCGHQGFYAAGTCVL